MGLVREFHTDEYAPSYSTLLVADAGRPEPLPHGNPPRPYPERSQPCGTVTRAGDGFLEGAARDGYHVVRLEYHDGPPLDDDWPDLVDTPYRSGTGAVGLAHVTGGPPAADLTLDGPGRYAVRVARRRGATEDEWCLRFWSDPDGSTVDGPRWLARTEPPTKGGRDGWDDVLGFAGRNHLGMLRAAVAATESGATAEQIEEYGRRYHRAPGWLDELILPDPPGYPPTGHADLDAQAAQAREEQSAMRAAELAELAGVAARLGAPAPRVVRDLLPVLVAAGLLTVDDSGGQPRYRRGRQRQADEVLDLPPEQARRVRRSDAHARYTSFATDLIAIAVWAPESPAVRTVDELAARLLATPAEVRATLGAWERVPVPAGFDARCLLVQPLLPWPPT
jgi:Family of unknown function (DUF6042)